MWKFWIRIVRARARLDSKVARTTRFRFRCCARSPKTGHMRLPSPLWGGVGGGGRSLARVRCPYELPPSPALPHKGGGSTPRLPLRLIPFATITLWFCCRSQKPRRPHQRAPHVRGRRVVEAEAFLRLLEIAPDDVDEIVEAHFGVGIEGIDVVHADEPRRHVVFVLARALVFLDAI